jgi:hypothetical protein
VTPAGPGVEAVLATDGTVTDVRPARGGAIPAGGSVLAGTGDGAAWLLDHAKAGMRVRAELAVVGTDGRCGPHADLGVVNGGPLLLARAASRTSMHSPRASSTRRTRCFLYRFGVRRNPRTIAGVTRRGHVLLATVDGASRGTAWERASKRRRRSCAASAPPTR